MAAPRGAASVALLALAAFAALVALPLRGGRSFELSSTGSDGRSGAARQKELTKMEEFAQGLVGKNVPVEDMASPYEKGFPRSYFRAAPNPKARYAWVCPGPSRLDDGESGACPEAATGYFRCCIDSSNGGAVTDDMCCPEKEKLSRRSYSGPPTAAVAKKLEKVLLGEVERLEKKELAATPAGNPDYISSSAAKQDLANYFNSYAAPAKPAPKAERQETATESRQELDAFLDQGLKELVVHKPRPEDVFPDARPAVRAVSSGLARDVTRPGSGLADAEKRMEFREWQREAVGRRGPSLLARMGEEQRRQQLGADAAGRATAQQWGRRRERFYTDVRGPVTSSFRAWNPAVGSGARAGEAGETLVPDDEVAMA